MTSEKKTVVACSLLSAFPTICPEPVLVNRVNDHDLNLEKVEESRNMLTDFCLECKASLMNTQLQKPDRKLATHKKPDLTPDLPMGWWFGSWLNHWVSSATTFVQIHLPILFGGNVSVPILNA